MVELLLISFRLRGLRRSSTSIFVDTVFTVIKNNSNIWNNYHSVFGPQSSGQRLGTLLKYGSTGFHDAPSALWQNSHELNVGANSMRDITKAQILTIRRNLSRGNITAITMGNYDSQIIGGSALQSEIIAYSTDQTGLNRKVIEGNIAKYFNIPLSKEAYINTWFDQSGNNNHLIQSNTGEQTLLRATTNSIDTKDYSLEFDGADDNFSLNILSGQTMNSVFSVFNRSNDSQTIFKAQSNGNRGGFARLGGFAYLNNYFLNGTSTGTTLSGASSINQEILASGLSGKGTFLWKFHTWHR